MKDRAGRALDAEQPSGGRSVSDLPDLVCLSHLRWDFVYQRPQHLLSRFARERRVFFIEEPHFGDGSAGIDVSPREDNLWVVAPHLPYGLPTEALDTAQRELIDGFLEEREIRDFILWYYTPMALDFSRHWKPLATVYDCMDELSAFRGAPPALLDREAELLGRADLVFTGGQGLFEAKRDRHASVHLFPSSIDRAHFARARARQPEVPQQAEIPRPRLGYFGVIDERMDLELLAGVADARPGWHLVMVGPTAKIDWEDLPQRPNIHYLGGADYRELPGLIAGWDVALIPFARNESTRFISPTKTPEYLAAGKPVVSTPIRDVVRPYGEQNLVRIAGTVPEFVAAAEAALAEDARTRAQWIERVDEFLAGMSWDRTWAGMAERIKAAVEAEQQRGRGKLALRNQPETRIPANLGGALTAT